MEIKEECKVGRKENLLSTNWNSEIQNEHATKSVGQNKKYIYMIRSAINYAGRKSENYYKNSQLVVGMVIDYSRHPKKMIYTFRSIITSYQTELLGQFFVQFPITSKTLIYQQISLKYTVKNFYFGLTLN